MPHEMKLLVVDASIASSAGGEEPEPSTKKEWPLSRTTQIFGSKGEPLTEHPNGRKCRECLKLVNQNGHIAVFCTKLLEEWKNHSSPFSVDWLTLMEQQSQIEFIDIPSEGAIESEIVRIVSHLETQRIMLKDAHLLDAAKAGDGIVLALDEKVRGHFHRISSYTYGIGSIIWMSPVIDSVCFTWLADTETDVEHLRLKHARI